MSPGDPTVAQFEAGRECFRRVELQLKLEANFIVETTLSGRSFRNVLATAKERGFTTTIVFVYLDSADTCVARVQERVRKGGHNVPEADVRRRFARSFHNFCHVYRQIADEWYVIHNSGGRYVDVAFCGQDGANMLNEDAFALFQSHATSASCDQFEAIKLGTARRIAELRKVGIRAMRFAQRESRRLGVPNVYSMGGVLYWELADGTLSRTDPYVDSTAAKSVTRS
jgi:predicted ABC-type ATPase